MALTATTVLGKKVKIKVDDNEVTAQLSDAHWESAASDSDFVSFADANGGGGRNYTFNFTAAQDLAVDTIWDLVYSSPGTDVDVVYMPFGNDVPSATQPHFTATITVTEPDGTFLGGEADPSNTAARTFEGAWPSTRPVKVTA